MLDTQCDQIGQNFAIWANFLCLGRNFFQELIYYWAIFWAKFYLLWANFFPSLFTIGRIFSEIWANFFSNRLVTLELSLFLTYYRHQFLACSCKTQAKFSSNSELYYSNVTTVCMALSVTNEPHDGSCVFLVRWVVRLIARPSFSYINKNVVKFHPLTLISSNLFKNCVFSTNSNKLILCCLGWWKLVRVWLVD